MCCRSLCGRRPPPRCWTGCDHSPTRCFSRQRLRRRSFYMASPRYPREKRRDLLESVVERMFAVHLAGRILPFDSAAARDYAVIAAVRRRSGRPISEPDARIAAIARSRGAELATRNVADFAGCELEVVNPWL